MPLLEIFGDRRVSKKRNHKVLYYEVRKMGYNISGLLIDDAGNQSEMVDVLNINLYRLVHWLREKLSKISEYFIPQPTSGGRVSSLVPLWQKIIKKNCHQQFQIQKFRRSQWLGRRLNPRA